MSRKHLTPFFFASTCDILGACPNIAERDTTAPSVIECFLLTINIFPIPGISSLFSRKPIAAPCQLLPPFQFLEEYRMSCFLSSSILPLMKTNHWLKFQIWVSEKPTSFDRGSRSSATQGLEIQSSPRQAICIFRVSGCSDAQVEGIYSWVFISNYCADSLFTKSGNSSWN